MSLNAKAKLTLLLGREPIVQRTKDGKFLVEYFNWEIAQNLSTTKSLLGETEDDAMDKLLTFMETSSRAVKDT